MSLQGDSGYNELPQHMFRSGIHRQEQERDPNSYLHSPFNYIILPHFQNSYGITISIQNQSANPASTIETKSVHSYPAAMQRIRDDYGSPSFSPPTGTCLWTMDSTYTYLSMEYWFMIHLCLFCLYQSTHASCPVLLYLISRTFPTAQTLSWTSLLRTAAETL
jgi:hypothetical protein